MDVSTNTWPGWDTAEHTVFHCSRWREDRGALRELLGRDAGPDDVEDMSCGPQTNWLPENEEERARITTAADLLRSAFVRTVESILSKKEEDERERQRRPAQE